MTSPAIRTFSLLLFASGLAWPARAQAGPFTFTDIADSRGAFSGFDPAASLSNAGQVAFGASLDSGGSGIFSGLGGPLSTVASTADPAFLMFGPAPSIAGDGTVGFSAIHVTPAGVPFFGIGTGSGGPVVFMENSLLQDLMPVSLTDAGNTVYEFRIHGEAFVVGAGAHNLLSGDLSSPFLAFGTPGVSPGGQVVFPATLDGATVRGSTPVIFPAGTTPGAGEGIFRGTGPFTVIADDAGPLSGFQGGAPSVNDSGTVAFRASLDSGGEGIFTGNGGPLTTVADTSDPLFVSFSGAPDINTGGLVAFLATYQDGSQGILLRRPGDAGDGSAFLPVISTGDSLLGSTVTDLGFYRDGLNDSGQVSFFARLADGTSAIFRADPVPEPATVLLFALGATVAGAACRRRGKKARSVR